MGDEFFYEYDGAGNLTRFDRWQDNDPGADRVETVFNTYNGANQLTESCVDVDDSGACSAGDTVSTHTYDAYGNLISDGTSTYTYDAENRLVSTTMGGVNSSYTYTGDGDRISQTVDGTLTTYVLDVATPLTMVLSETTSGVTTKYWHGLDLLAQSDGTDTEYLTYDGLGSVRQVTGDTGVVALAQTFDPYGNLYSRVGVNSTRFGFTGEAQDANGLLFLRARYYSAGMGRFLNSDPSRQEQHPYLYALANPVLYTDPSGLCASCTTSGGGGGLPQISLNLTINLNPEFLAKAACALAANQDLQDLLEGIGDQLALDLVQPAYGAMLIAIHIPAYSYFPVSSGANFTFPLSSLRVFTNAIEAKEAELNNKFQTGSTWYKTGRLVGRSLSWGIGIVMVVDGFLTFEAGMAGVGASGLGTFLTGGAAAAVAVPVATVSVGVVAVGVAVGAYGGAILAANLIKPVGGSGGGKPSSVSADDFQEIKWRSGLEGKNTTNPSGPEFALKGPEKAFPAKVLQKCPSCEIFRPNQKVGAGDFIVKSGNRGWIVELKTSAGSFAGTQLRNAADAARLFGLESYEVVTVTVEEFLILLGG